MTLTNNIAAKLAVAFVAVAMAMTLVAPAANAQTEAELQAQIDQLLATIASLQGQIGGSTSASSCTYTFTRDLNQGSTGPEVMDLQKFLNTDPETTVAVSGAGSAGMETQYFGPATAAAVSKFQVKYRADVLTPVGLVNPTGYWGSSSRAKANALCTADAGSGDDDDDDDSTSGDLNGGEASLESFSGTSGDDSDVKEGSDGSIAEFEFDVEDGDVEVNRIDLAFSAASGNDSGADDDPWDVFEEIAIYVDGDEIASMDASDEDEWSDDDPTTGQHKLRFSGLDWVVREGDTAEFTVVVEVSGSVDEADTTPTWYVFVPQDGIRAEDGAGIQNYIGEADASNATVTDYDEEVSFDIDEEGGDDELVINSSSDDVDATVLEVNESSKSDWITVFAFDLDTDDSENDITVETAVVGLQFSGTTYASAVSDVRLVIDGEEYDDVTVTGTTNATLTFDLDKDLVIDAGDEVTAELQVEFKQQSGNYDDGDTVTATTTSTGWEAEGADDLTVGTSITGSATGETHTLRTSGVVLSMVSTTETYVENSDSSTTDNEGIFKISFDVTAFEDDIWIAKSAASGTATTSGVVYEIEDNTGATDDDVTESGVLTSTADTDSSQFVVREGETETFTLTVEVDPASAGFYQLQLYGVNFAAGSASAVDVQQRALPESEYETDPLSI